MSFSALVGIFVLFNSLFLLCVCVYVVCHRFFFSICVSVLRQRNHSLHVIMMQCKS